MEDYRERQGWRERQLDTVASVSADTGRTGVRSQRAMWAKVCQTCIDVWESCLRRADGHHYEDLMTVPAREKVCKYLSLYLQRKSANVYILEPETEISGKLVNNYQN